MPLVPSSAIFDRQQRLGWIAGSLLLILGLIESLQAGIAYFALGKAPESLSIEQAMPTVQGMPDRTRWVALSGLELDCSQSLKESEGSEVTSTTYLASDASHQRWLDVTFEGDAPCRFPSMPVQGLLSIANPHDLKYLANQKMTLPTSPYPMMELAAGNGPDTCLPWLGFSLVSAGIGAVVIVGVARRKRVA
jgi:hypothetical protein